MRCEHPIVISDRQLRHADSTLKAFFAADFIQMGVLSAAVCQCLYISKEPAVKAPLDNGSGSRWPANLRTSVAIGPVDSPATTLIRTRTYSNI